MSVLTTPARYSPAPGLYLIDSDSPVCAQTHFSCMTKKSAILNLTQEPLVSHHRSWQTGPCTCKTPGVLFIIGSIIRAAGEVHFIIFTSGNASSCVRYMILPASFTMLVGGQFALHFQLR